MININSSFVLVISGGPMSGAVDAIRELADKASQIICADSGTDYAIKAGCSISKVFGDFDSITSEGLEYISSNNIPAIKFPCEKDMTDTELVLDSIDSDSDIVLFCSLQGRIDHVMANVLLGCKYKTRGRNIVITDGVSELYYLCGNEKLHYIDNSNSQMNKVVTLLPLDLCNQVTGVTTEGLYYKLDDATLDFGSSLGVSNKFLVNSENPNGKMFEICIKSGIMGVLVTNEV